ncbi:unnamed protein product (macronuclear) [Paramecium tetraurelia]|uniref:Uncharacterized protein n=1 Tax=Paramecium tetraurelia TaxID=5888 RepID=A0BD05_PARTE|nr:uncharacterized protein GSPATT00004516001 [Paramecium tetraurelia]CAK56422.1 unnamed protein product [Paramecium tetraurelia]|eukprot:XP_001423820.1 hypothetical protein (macronuclear) [Paramecium tetraurelia strain d4-2]
MNFYRYFKFLTTKIQQKYYAAKSLIAMLIEKYQIVQRLNELQLELQYHLDNQVGDLAHQSLEQLKKHEWVQQERDLKYQDKRYIKYVGKGLKYQCLQNMLRIVPYKRLLLQINQINQGQNWIILMTYSKNKYQSTFSMMWLEWKYA